eukprot:comp12624_c0_seq1/m.7664 comp12624_c0_seq1/g.7664  ORF comp12624_c0_seq1/g.7664 comp12624_c0_seq1/m.7664 type:complete len:252 (-) comp12624_c0_seq1:107-862(-)
MRHAAMLFLLAPLASASSSAEPETLSGSFSADTANVASCSSEKAPYMFHLPNKVKTLHLIRHAEGVHNEAKDKEGRKAYDDWRWVDAALTIKGRQQAQRAREDYFAHFGWPDLVAVSPLRRTLQTATEIFGIDSKVPFVAVEDIRERYGVHPCDQRSSMAVHRPAFPHVDFSLITSDEDTLWLAGERESRENMRVRALRFLEWVQGRAESTIAVVSHQDFLQALIAAVPGPQALQGRFENCERRTVVLTAP